MTKDRVGKGQEAVTDRGDGEKRSAAACTQKKNKFTSGHYI